MKRASAIRQRRLQSGEQSPLSYFRPLLFFILTFHNSIYLPLGVCQIGIAPKRKPPQFQLENAHGMSVLEQQRFLNFQFAVNQFSRLNKITIAVFGKPSSVKLAAIYPAVGYIWRHLSDCEDLGAMLRKACLIFFFMASRINARAFDLPLNTVLSQ
jgi:hypothetical protein